jgi:hypothetical protein
MEVSGYLHAKAVLALGEGRDWYPLGRRLVGPQIQSGRGGEEVKSPARAGYGIRNHPARDLGH